MKNCVAEAPRRDHWIMILTLIDILFLPYFFVVTITYTFFLVIWWYFKHRSEIKHDNKDYGLFRFLCLLMIMSSLVGVILDGSSLKDNAVYCLQYIAAFMHFYAFKYYFDRYSINLKPYLIWFLIFVVALAVAFNFRRDVYYALREIWSPVQSAGLISTNEDFEKIGRFGFIWMDENNIAYMLNCVVMFLLCNERTSLAEKLFIIVCDIFVLIASMSRGGMLTFFIGAGLIAFLKISGNGIRRTISNKKKCLGYILFIGIAIFLFSYGPSYLQSDVSQASMERLDSREDTRKRIYTYIMENANFEEYVFLGHGVRTLINGKPIKPHNIHFYLIFVYGMIAWGIIMYMIFRKRRQTKVFEYIWIIPFFLGASSNIIIGEEKAMCIAMLLLAASTSKKYLIERRN